MPRYFFDALGARLHHEAEVDLKGPHEARLYAIKFAGHCIHRDPALLSEADDFKVEVRNATGLHLFTVTAFISEGLAVGQAPTFRHDAGDLERPGD